ncbi:hypothetical protein SAMN05444277_101104 [Parafilimonas terrae]|uniref:Uncharacterized protein n=1 Tax=Parafilimonas terrae TaxID=1465490 RepID=A0A1I5R7A3_9BACT|nr:hypothetical protein SAMN05444277_101104 [Parafilimonas terrae]
MDVLDEELLRFWKALNKNNVLYIMVDVKERNYDAF